jgi:hypothetical protein
MNGSCSTCEEKGDIQNSGTDMSSFTSGGSEGFAGYESFIKNGSCGYLVRIITPASRLEANDEFMRSLVSGFAISEVR